MPGSLPLTITSPAPGASVDAATVTVTGTTAPGATVDAESQGSAGGAAATASATADSKGDWSVTLAASFGTDTITATATQGDATGYAQTSVSYFVLPGTQLLNVSDPSGDDNGPGTYQYPTASDFQPGAFDLLGVSVNQTSSDVYLTVKIRNLASTFGSAFGAQLLDVYVHSPSATSTSTAAAYPSVMNYTIAPADAWSERLEAQGFASPGWVDPSGNSLGAAQLIEDQSAGTVTLVMPTSAFGTVGSGWVFTVALTGQGAGNPPVRNFAQPAQPYSFGVCPAGDTTDAICSVNPNKVAEVMDTIPPAGVTQAGEWDQTTGTAALQGVAVP
jgi:glucoamylase